jgi:hypothetical protein
MGEDLLPKPTTPSIQLNDENHEDIITEIGDNENLMFVAHLCDIHYEHYEINPNDLYIDAHNLIVVHIFKKNFAEGTDFKKMMKTLLGNDIVILDPKMFI